MNVGCLTSYTSDVISLDKNNNTLAKMNSAVTVEQFFCI
jgi:hypothetical protein